MGQLVDPFTWPATSAVRMVTEVTIIAIATNSSLWTRRRMVGTPARLAMVRASEPNAGARR